MSRLSRRTRALALLPLLGLVELAGARWAATRAPRMDEYVALAAPVRSLRREGDLVVVAPRWAEPLVRRALGDALMPIADLGRSDERRYARAIEISLLHERATELSAFVERERRTVGPFTVRVVENPAPERVVFDFVARLAPPHAEVGGCRHTTSAAPSGGCLEGPPAIGPARFLCAGDGERDVGPTTIADERFLPRRCISAAPPARGPRIVRYRGVPLGDRLVGHAGRSSLADRRPGPPVDLEILVDGERLGLVTRRAGGGWAPFSFALGRHAQASSATVEFRVSAPEPAGPDFCFQADTR